MTASGSDMLLDVTRLLWRRWRGRLPTGVDRVCLAYVEHFGPRALAVVQRRGVQLTLAPQPSQRLFSLLLEGGPDFRQRLLLVLLRSLATLSLRPPPTGALYLNVGHTGLDEAALPAWIARHRLRAVYLIHDVIPITHPQYCRPGEDRKHARRMMNALNSARGIITNSQATADEVRTLAAQWNIPMPPTLAAWLGGNALPRQPAATSPARPYFLVLGTIEGRKNHLLLLQVWRRLAERLGSAAPRLVIVGARGWEADAVFRQLDSLGPLQGFIEERPHCTDDELGSLMTGARALLMPSHVEGYGLPVFEALDSGTPVIAADLAVYREVAGSLPLYLPPDDTEAWEVAILRYMHDGPERAEQLARIAGFRVPNWTSHFRKVEDWLHALP